MPDRTLSDQVTDFIFQYIDQNRLKLGDSLPSEIKTSTELKISRGIVREAFRSLRTTGIIEVGNGRPPRVGVLSNSFLTHLMSHALSTEQITPEQVLDLRMSIEVRAAELAAQGYDDDTVKQLRKYIRGMKKSLKVPDEFVEWDIRFHETINGATGNPLVEVFGGAMRDCMAKTIRAGLLRRTSGRELAEIIETHVDVADAIEARSATKAGAAMRRHFSVARKALHKNGVRTAP